VVREPDGSAIAWAQVTADNVISVEVVELETGARTSFNPSFFSFYLQWRPDSAAIVILGGVPTSAGQHTGLATLDLDSGAVTNHHSAASFYLTWSPDGASMVTHLDSSRIELYDVAGRTQTPIASPTGSWQAADWMPDGSGFLYVQPSDSFSASARSQLGAQALSLEELVIQRIETGAIKVLARAETIPAFAVAPDGSTVAYSSFAGTIDGELTLVDVTSGETRSKPIGLLDAWQWSPDSSALLILAVDAQNFAATYQNWNGESLTEYATGRLTALFASRYVTFWGQYNRSHSLWAPDSSGFAFPSNDLGIDTIFFQALD
jgi:TolB protein